MRAPQNDPRYDTMPGTDAMWWLDWDVVYRTWAATALRVVVTIQFTTDDFPASTWLPDPYGAAYQLGYRFARHFGPTSGKGLVSAVEFGNEPWDYNATFYTTVRGWVWHDRSVGRSVNAGADALSACSCPRPLLAQTLPTTTAHLGSHQLLQGYVAGVKAADPALMVLSCALQASSPFA